MRLYDKMSIAFFELFFVSNGILALKVLSCNFILKYMHDSMYIDRVMVYALIGYRF